MTTTFEKFKDARPGNYCTLPTIDVEIVSPPAYCTKCNGTMVWDPKANHGSGGLVHETAPDPDVCRWASAATRCQYCGTNERGVAVFHQRAWSDEIHCSRCGGVHGYGIGD